MAWIESHQSLAHHPKLAKLARELKITRAQAIGHLHFLWWWALDYAVHGNLSSLDPDVIATASDWTKDAQKFVDALISSGFLDKDLTIHDWMEYTSRFVVRRESDRERQRRHRHNKESQADCDSHGDVTRDTAVTSQLSHGDVTRDTAVTSPLRHSDVTVTSPLRHSDVTVTSPLRHGATCTRTRTRTKEEEPPQGGVQGSTEEVPRARVVTRGEGNAEPVGQNASSTPQAVQDSVVPGKDVNWPTRNAWHGACEMEALPADQEQSEWDNQERKPPHERWRNIAVDRLRHHAAFVRSKWQERGRPKSNGASGADQVKKEPSLWDLKQMSESLEKLVQHHRGRPDSIAASVTDADRQDYREKKKQLNAVRERIADHAKPLTPEKAAS
jgi:hypothetical protein